MHTRQTVFLFLYCMVVELCVYYNVVNVCILSFLLEYLPSSPLLPCFTVYNSFRAYKSPGSRRNTSGNRAPQPSSSIHVIGNLGVSPLPGSSRVYDREERVMKECASSVICPLAAQETITTYKYSKGPGSGTQGAKYGDTLPSLGQLSWKAAGVETLNASIG